MEIKNFKNVWSLRKESQPIVDFQIGKFQLVETIFKFTAKNTITR